MNRKTAPGIVDAVNFNLHLRPYELYTLDNGLPVYSIHACTQDVTQVEIEL